MAQFRKKPVVIEAVQHFADRGQHANEWPAWLIQAINSGSIFARGNQTVIKTLEGEHIASDGDWIIRGVKGELYPCKPDIFAATYEPALATREEAEAGAWCFERVVPSLEELFSVACYAPCMSDIANDRLRAHVKAIRSAVIAALRAQPQAREDAQPVAWRCSREWPSDGLGKWQYHDGPPNPSHLARNVQALFLHPTPDPQPVGWLRAVDEEMVCAHLGVADAEDSFETAKKKLASLIQWNIAVATDPSVGGYPAPDALRVAVEAFMPLAEVAFLWSKETPPDEEVQRYRERYWAVKEALATLK